MTDIGIRVNNLSKCYHLYDSPRHRLMQFVAPRLQRLAGLTPKQYFREFWALKNVSFEIKKCETAGNVGRNGTVKILKATDCFICFSGATYIYSYSPVFKGVVG